jgi:competence protein ComEA
MSSNWIKDYLTFTQKERIALIVLLSLIVSVFFLPDIIPSKQWKASEKDIAAFQSLTKSLQKDSLNTDIDQNYSQAYLSEPSIEQTYVEVKLFPFDPNTISGKQWQQLGIRAKTISTIQKYLSKGGKIRKPEDLRKIYGISEQDYLRLKPYIRIVESKNEGAFIYSKDSSQNRGHTYINRNEPKFSMVELNTADTTALIQLPGIGSKLANRIIRFRDKLGGFYAVEQVGETYGLPDSTFQKIKSFLILGNKPVERIRINVADPATLKEHPYIGWTLARLLVEYRNQHGPFQRVGDILKVSSILPEQLKRLIPYLSID